MSNANFDTRWMYDDNIDIIMEFLKSQYSVSSRFDVMELVENIMKIVIGILNQNNRF